MNIRSLSIRMLVPLLLLAGYAHALADEGHKHKTLDQEHSNTVHDHHNHQDEHSRTEITERTATDSGISTKLASPGTIQKSINAYGLISVPPDRIIHVQARFPGIVKEVKVAMGEQVQQGDVLAIIESNESLKSYEVTAAMNGTVQHRLINVGELTDEGTLFTLINTQVLWAELRIFPNQRKHLRANQAVELHTENESLSTNIDHVTASLANTPFVTARAFIKNDDNLFFPGEFAKATITTEELNVDILVDNNALQTLDGNDVVFIKNGAHFERRIVQLGVSDERHTEIIAGLNAGEEYVTKNSYLIKADIEKSSAEHHH